MDENELKHVVEAALLAAHHNGLQEPLRLQGSGEFLQPLRIKMLSRLVGIRMHLRHRQLQQFGLASRLCPFKEGSQPSTECFACHILTLPWSSAGRRPPHCCQCHNE